MAINATTVWRVRVGGNDNNGGAFDAAIVGAGTDYSDQDAAQLTLTDLTTSGASAVISSATGGFTAAMIGNAIRIASGTSFTVGTYFIVAVGSSNSATLDRNCSTASGSGGVGRVGGAFASPFRPSATGIVSGNTIMVAGQGSNDPVDTDYFTAASMSVPNGTTFVGYNGRPKIGHNGRFFNQNQYNLHVKNCSFLQTAGTNTNLGVVHICAASVVENCVFDTGGFDAIQLSSVSAYFCSIINTGSQVPGTQVAYDASSTDISQVIIGLHVKDVRGVGVKIGTRASMANSIVQNCGSHGIDATAITGLGANYNIGVSVTGCTIHGNGGSGILISNPYSLCADNLISGHVAPGKYGIEYTANPTVSGRNHARTARNNFYGNTNNSNYALSALDTTIDPQYVNAPTDLTPTNTALRYLAGIGSL